MDIIRGRSFSSFFGNPTGITLSSAITSRRYILEGMGTQISSLCRESLLLFLLENASACSALMVLGRPLSSIWYCVLSLYSPHSPPLSHTLSLLCPSHSLSLTRSLPQSIFLSLLSLSSITLSTPSPSLSLSSYSLSHVALSYQSYHLSISFSYHLSLIPFLFLLAPLTHVAFLVSPYRLSLSPISLFPSQSHYNTIPLSSPVSF